MTPDRIQRGVFGAIALGCTVAALVLLWRACAVCRTW